MPNEMKNEKCKTQNANIFGTLFKQLIFLLFFI